MSYFSEALKAALAGTTQAQFAVDSGIDRPAISDFCTGKRLPDSRLEKILNALGDSQRLPVFIAYLQDKALEIGLPAGILPNTYTIAINEEGENVPANLSSDFYTITQRISQPNGEIFAELIHNLATMALDQIAQNEPSQLIAEHPTSYVLTPIPGKPGKHKVTDLSDAETERVSSRRGRLNKVPSIPSNAQK